MHREGLQSDLTEAEEVQKGSFGAGVAVRMEPGGYKEPIQSPTTYFIHGGVQSHREASSGSEARNEKPG